MLDEKPSTITISYAKNQIALHTVGKFYSLNPRIEVEIEEMEKEDERKRSD